MTDEPTQERVFQITNGGWASAILAAGLKHSAFTHIAKGADMHEAVVRIDFQETASPVTLVLAS